ncbi:sigma-70 family RNA polymerase sigma factor [Pantoea sp. B566]|uniref:RNA polymerase sigma factor n=1 Tax=Pantoea sp. B566 TaxID=2974030 RepID=UPI002164F73F|nr:sigma-70 family RNA polymerase sigma factor [Pantoea sp. B566]MCS3401818.1 sigma-70 family RNA polymerase sigma factor [Pantoea sp. B566]
MKASASQASSWVKALTLCRTKLQRFIRARTPAREEADDILQEITCQLIGVEQPVENISAWLFRAARNEMTDRARKKRELPLASYMKNDEDGVESELAETLFGIPQTPEDDYLRALLWDALEAALAELPPAQYEVFDQTELQGISYNALSELTGVSVQTLLSRKHKAVLYLRMRLRAVYDDLVSED